LIFFILYIFKHCGNCHSYENVILFETFPWGASFLLSTYWKGDPPFSKDLWHLVWRKDMYCLLLWLLLQTGRGNFPQKSFFFQFFKEIPNCKARFKQEISLDIIRKLYQSNKWKVRKNEDHFVVLLCSCYLLTPFCNKRYVERNAFSWSRYDN